MNSILLRKRDYYVHLLCKASEVKQKVFTFLCAITVNQSSFQNFYS